MKKSIIFLVLGIILFLLSVILFVTIKETVTPNCKNTCGKFIKYTDAFITELYCPLSCFENTNNQSFTYHNPIYVPFVWLGLLFILLGLIFLIIKK
jgi:hypothetical protein